MAFIMMVDVKKVVDALIDHKNVLLYGPPGTGKSYLMKAVESYFRDESAQLSNERVMINAIEERVPFYVAKSVGVSTRWVTFHQGYSYEDFILGMRPIAAPQGGFSIKPRAGVLLELAAQALQGGRGLLLIDEINRGNTSRIFGEFITLMDYDKRLDEQGEFTNTTVKITLPYLSQGEFIDVITDNGIENINREFAMPAKVYTLASMNSVDKSISPIDTALRRRFHIINLSPTKSAILQAVGLSEDIDIHFTLQPSENISAEGVAMLAAAVLIKLNRSIGLYLGNDFMLGQWYLPSFICLDAEDARARLAETWLYRILPQLIELFHGRDEQLSAILQIQQIKNGGSGINLCEANEVESEFGATSYIEVAAPTPSMHSVLEFLQQFVSNESSN
jgi:5-methylcytosine-specific restriction enzyme B